MMHLKAIRTLTLFGSLLLINVNSANTPKTPAALMEFNIRNDIGTPGASQLLPILLSNHLKKQFDWELQERIELRQVIQEQQLQEALLENDEAAVEMGKLKGAKLIVTGSAMKIGKNHIISAKILNVESAQLEQSATVRFEKPENLERAMETLSLRLAGKTERQIHTFYVARGLNRTRIGAAALTGWGHSRIERWAEVVDGGSEYVKKEQEDYPGLGLDFFWRHSLIDFTLFGGIPNHIGFLGAQTVLYPSTHFGVGFSQMWQNATVVSQGIERGVSEWNVSMLLLSFRPSAEFRFLIGKGFSHHGTMKYRDEEGVGANRNLEYEFDFFKGPTMAQAEYHFKESSYYLMARYYHDLAHSEIYPDKNIQYAVSGSYYDQVIALQRWFMIGVGGSFAIN